jgi:SsrA-binding protein
MAKPKPTHVTIALNRRARYDYFITDEMEAGIVLTGSEVKSLRNGRASIAESYAAEKNGEIHLINAHIPEYAPANRFNHEPKRHRKLLLHRREINSIIGALQRKGVTLIPLEMFFNEKGIAKLKLGLATGKKKHDKRETEKNRDWQRQKARIMADHK